MQEQKPYNYFLPVEMNQSHTNEYDAIASMQAACKEYIESVNGDRGEAR